METEREKPQQTGEEDSRQVKAAKSKALRAKCWERSAESEETLPLWSLVFGTPLPPFALHALPLALCPLPFAPCPSPFALRLLAPFLPIPLLLSPTDLFADEGIEKWATSLPIIEHLTTKKH